MLKVFFVRINECLKFNGRVLNISWDDIDYKDVFMDLDEMEGQEVRMEVICFLFLFDYMKVFKLCVLCYKI